MKITPLLLLLFSAASLETLKAQSETINWGSALFPGGNLIDSNGDAITLGDGSFTDGGFTFELGTFDTASGFTGPTAGNTSDWVTNWRAFDAIVSGDGDANDFVRSNGTFAAQDTLTSDRHSLSVDAAVDPAYEFAVDAQAYVFVRNSDATEAGSEWLLYTNPAWEFPFVAAESHSPNNLTWEVEDATQAVWGGINGGTTTGGGVNNFGDPNFLIQTFTFVPEPSSAGLLLLGALSLLRRGRRS